jgi:GT2 family glycosyltransferase
MNAILTDRSTASVATQSSVCVRPATASEGFVGSGAREAAGSGADASQSGSEPRAGAGNGPLFSVIVTTYNRPALLKRALDSLQKQTLRDFEVIVVNDHGESVEPMLGEFDLDITYVCHGRNRGPSAARNIALRLARGELIGYLDDDDVVLPEHLAVHAKAHAAHTNSVVYTDARFVLSKEGGLSIATDPASEEVFSKESLFVRNFITINNWTLPRQMLVDVGDCDETLTALEDWDVLLRLAERFPFVHVRERTSEVWFHGDMHARLTARQNKNFPELYRKLYERYGDLGSQRVREGRRRVLAQLDAGTAERPVEDYQSLSAKLRLDESSDAFRARVAVLAAAVSATAVIIDPERDSQAVERTLRSLREQCLGPAHIIVSSQVTGTDATGTDPTAALNAALGQTGTELAVCIPAGDTLDRYALLLLAERFANHTDMVCCYVDEDNIASGKQDGPIFKPDINLDLLRSYPYVGSCLAIRTRAFVELGGWRSDFKALANVDLLFRCLEQYGMQNIGHVAEVLHHSATPYPQWLSSAAVAEESPRIVDAHLQRLGIAHEVHPGGAAGVNRIEYRCMRTPPVSIVIPAGDSLPTLNGLIDSLLAKTSYKNYELLLVDTGSRDPAVRAYLDGIEGLHNPQWRVLHEPQACSCSAACNAAARQARGEYLILLKTDTAVLQENWVEALLNHAQRPEVGVVGAKLYRSDGRIQHAGMVLGLRGPADHPFIGGAMDATGYMQRLQVDQNYTAVSAACLMIRKSVYEEVGGLDEQDFKISYNDVDLCLKVREAGYLTVWTPYARMMHEGRVGPSKIDKTAQEAERKRLKGEQQAMYRKWLPLLADDPAYNRNLGLTGSGFDLDQTRHTAWQPFEQPLLPRMFCVAADADGCGQYRIRQPLLAMQREGIAEGLLAPAHLTPVLMERFMPSSIVLQRQLTAEQLVVMHDYRAFSRAFKVYELDDYLPNVPLKSVHRKDMPKDILRMLRKAVALTDRFVVSTEPLAEQFAGFHSDIRVVLNRLPVEWWGGLSSERRKSAKPRVGWAGGVGHRGDLELIVDVVRDLADEVEWVFFGLCPQKLRPYVHEVHDGVPIEQYPAALAALNLDLALAPLEDNTFNACKSNLRLLEYGACGFPVVCSDIVCYRGDLPVTRVRNRYRDWVDAIRMHLADMDATAKAGDALCETVHRDWMLTGDNLVAWRNAWLPDA